MKSKKMEYVEKLSAQMVEWDTQIEELKDKAENAASVLKQDYADAIEALQARRDEAAQKLQGLSVASDDGWEDLRAEVDELWAEVKTILHDAFTKSK